MASLPDSGYTATYHSNSQILAFPKDRLGNNKCRRQIEHSAVNRPKESYPRSFSHGIFLGLASGPGSSSPGPCLHWRSRSQAPVQITHPPTTHPQRGTTTTRPLSSRTLFLASWKPTAIAPPSEVRVPSCLPYVQNIHTPDWTHPSPGRLTQATSMGWRYPCSQLSNAEWDEGESSNSTAWQSPAEFTMRSRVSFRCSGEGCCSGHLRVH
ncbi:hypothetical protein V8F33_001653 [Rhypophila sp. PSN 637]